LGGRRRCPLDHRAGRVYGGLVVAVVVAHLERERVEAAGGGDVVHAGGGRRDGEVLGQGLDPTDAEGRDGPDGAHLVVGDGDVVQSHVTGVGDLEGVGDLV